MKYTVILHKSKYGYDTHAPALPGCHSQGDSEKEAIENIQDAICVYFGMKQKKFKNQDIVAALF